MKGIRVESSYPVSKKKKDYEIGVRKLSVHHNSTLGIGYSGYKSKSAISIPESTSKVESKPIKSKFIPDNAPSAMGSTPEIGKDGIDIRSNGKNIKKKKSFGVAKSRFIDEYPKKKRKKYEQKKKVIRGKGGKLSNESMNQFFQRHAGFRNSMKSPVTPKCMQGKGGKSSRQSDVIRKYPSSNINDLV